MIGLKPLLRAGLVSPVVGKGSFLDRLSPPLALSPCESHPRPESAGPGTLQHGLSIELPWLAVLWFTQTPGERRPPPTRKLRKRSAERLTESNAHPGAVFHSELLAYDPSFSLLDKVAGGTRNGPMRPLEDPWDLRPVTTDSADYSRRVVTLVRGAPVSGPALGRRPVLAPPRKAVAASHAQSVTICELRTRSTPASGRQPHVDPTREPFSVALSLPRLRFTGEVIVATSGPVSPNHGEPLSFRVRPGSAAAGQP